MQRRILGQYQPAQPSRTEQTNKHGLQYLDTYLSGDDTS
jgi:hypothetical protein